MKTACLIFRSGSDLFVRPGPMRDGPLQQRAVTKVVRKSRFEQVEVRKLNPLFLQGGFICNEAGSIVEGATKLPAMEYDP